MAEMQFDEEETVEGSQLMPYQFEPEYTADERVSEWACS